MNYRLIIILVGVAVLGTGLTLYFVLRDTQPSPGGQEVTSHPKLPIAGESVKVPSGTGTSVPAGQIILMTTDGKYLTTSDFLKTQAEEDSHNAGYYNLGPRPEVTYSDDTRTIHTPFLITYIAATQYFNVVLLQEPIGRSRLVAQEFLLQSLGISAKDLCRLNYTVSTPTSVSQLYGGSSLGFSFCPGAIPLPQ